MKLRNHNHSRGSSGGSCCGQDRFVPALTVFQPKTEPRPRDSPLAIIASWTAYASPFRYYTILNDKFSNSNAKSIILNEELYTVDATRGASLAASTSPRVREFASSSAASAGAVGDAASFEMKVHHLNT